MGPLVIRALVRCSTSGRAPRWEKQGTCVRVTAPAQILRAALKPRGGRHMSRKAHHASDAVDQGLGQGLVQGTMQGEGTCRGVDPYDTLCFSGADASCQDMLACVQALKAKVSLDGVSHFLGTSSGAVAALVLFCGLEADPAAQRMVRAFDKLGCGRASANECRGLLRALMQDKFGAGDVSMAQLHAGCGATLTLVATHAETGEPVYVSHDTFPHTDAASACMASMVAPMDPCAVHMLRRGSGACPKAFVPVTSGYFSDVNPIAGAHAGARVLNIVPGTEFDGDASGDVAARALLLLAKRNAVLMEALHTHVHRDVVHITRRAPPATCPPAPKLPVQVHTDPARANVLAVAKEWSTFPESKRTFLRAFTALDSRFDEWRRADDTCAEGRRKPRALRLDRALHGRHRGHNYRDNDRDGDEDGDVDEDGGSSNDSSPGAILDAVNGAAPARS